LPPPRSAKKGESSQSGSDSQPEDDEGCPKRRRVSGRTIAQLKVIKELELTVAQHVAGPYTTCQNLLLQAQDSSLADGVTLRSRGTSFQVHKDILFQSCEEFAALLSAPMIESLLRLPSHSIAELGAQKQNLRPPYFIIHDSPGWMLVLQMYRPSLWRAVHLHLMVTESPCLTCSCVPCCIGPAVASQKLTTSMVT